MSDEDNTTNPVEEDRVIDGFQKPPKSERAEQPALEDAPEVPVRRVRMLMVNPADFMYLFTKGLKLRKGAELVSGVPEDAELIQVAADPVRYGIILVVQSETYDEVPINVMPPVELVSIQIGKGHNAKLVRKPSLRRPKR